MLWHVLASAKILRKPFPVSRLYLDYQPKAVEGNAVSRLPEERGEVVEVPVGVDAAPVPGCPLVHLLVLRQRLVKLVQHAPGAGHAV